MKNWIIGGVIGAGIGIILFIISIIAYILGSRIALYFLFIPCIKILNLSGDSALACAPIHLIGPGICLTILIILGLITGSFFGLIFKNK